MNFVQVLIVFSNGFCCGRNLGTSNKQSELLLCSVFNLGYDLRKRTNVTIRGEAATNPSGVEGRSRRAN